MPYIPQEDREKLDPSINHLIDLLKTLPEDKKDGNANYTIFKIIYNLFELDYRGMKDAEAVLVMVGKEYNRRVVAPYEDKKLDENGDIL